METLIVVAIVGGTAVLAGRSLYRTFTGRRVCHCGGACLQGCPRAAGVAGPTVKEEV